MIALSSTSFAMTFSQPVTIGYVGYTPQPTFKYLPIANATYNKWDDKAQWFGVEQVVY